MEKQEMFKKMIDFQKTTFDTTFDMVAQVQDQAQGMVKEMLDKTPTIPEKSVAAYNAWMDACQKGRQTFKSTVDSNFETWASYFEEA